MCVLTFFFRSVARSNNNLYICRYLSYYVLKTVQIEYNYFTNLQTLHAIRNDSYHVRISDIQFKHDTVPAKWYALQYYNKIYNSIYALLLQPFAIYRWPVNFSFLEWKQSVTTIETLSKDLNLFPVR